MGVPREEYWSGLPLPSPGGPLDSGPHLLNWQADSLPLTHQGSPILSHRSALFNTSWRATCIALCNTGHSVFSNYCQPDKWKVASHCYFHFSFLTISKVEPLFICLFYFLKISSPAYLDIFGVLCFISRSSLFVTNIGLLIVVLSHPRTVQSIDPDKSRCFSWTLDSQQSQLWRLESLGKIWILRPRPHSQRLLLFQWFQVGPRNQNFSL